VAKNAEADGEEPVEAKPLEGDEPTESGEAPVEEAKPEDDVSTKLAEAEKFRTEVTAKATEVLRENAGLQRKLDWLMEAVEAAGLEVDPQALELFDLRTEKELGADFTKKAAEQAEQARKADHERAVAAEVVKVNSEIAKAAKAAKVSESDLKARWAVSVRLWQSQGGKGDMPTLDDAVFEIQAVSNARQVKQSTSAPALVRSKGPTSAAKPRNENTHDGWRRHLRSQGFAD
jgi:predicted HNH restriction endonuclease